MARKRLGNRWAMYPFSRCRSLSLVSAACEQDGKPPPLTTRNCSAADFSTKSSPTKKNKSRCRIAGVAPCLARFYTVDMRSRPEDGPTTDGPRRGNPTVRLRAPACTRARQGTHAGHVKNGWSKHGSSVIPYTHSIPQDLYSPCLNLTNYARTMFIQPCFHVAGHGTPTLLGSLAGEGQLRKIAHQKSTPRKSLWILVTFSNGFSFVQWKLPKYVNFPNGFPLGCSVCVCVCFQWVLMFASTGVRS